MAKTNSYHASPPRGFRANSKTASTKVRLGTPLWALGILLAALSHCSATSSKDPSEEARENRQKSIVQAPEGPERELLESATQAYDEGLYSIAREKFQELRTTHPTSYFSTIAELKTADTYFFSGQYTEAIAQYEEFIKMHPRHEALPYVLFQTGQSHLKKYRGILHDQTPLHLALEALQKTLSEHPESIYASKATQEIEDARTKLAEHEIEVARYYKRQGFLQASIRRYESLLSNFADTKPGMLAKNELAQIQ